MRDKFQRWIYWTLDACVLVALVILVMLVVVLLFAWFFAALTWITGN